MKHIGTALKDWADKRVEEAGEGCLPLLREIQRNLNRIKDGEIKPIGDDENDRQRNNIAV